MTHEDILSKAFLLNTEGAFSRVAIGKEDEINKGDTPTLPMRMSRPGRDEANHKVSCDA